MSDVATALGEYLRARRALIQPTDVGLVPEAGRKVSGLRVEEVAELAGISAAYYRRVEQGKVAAPSEEVLIGLARALILDTPGQEYLRRLAGWGTFTNPEAGVDVGVERALDRLLAQWSHTPAAIQSRHFDIVRTNDLLESLAPGQLLPGANFIELFFSLEDRTAVPEWEETAAYNAAALRYHGDPDNPRFRDVVGRLLVRDRDFRRLWARQDVRPFDAGRSWHVLQPYGVFSLRFQNFQVPGTDGYLMTVFFAEPGSLGETVLQDLATAAVSMPQAETM